MKCAIWWVKIPGILTDGIMVSNSWSAQKRAITYTYKFPCLGRSTSGVVHFPYWTGGCLRTSQTHLSVRSLASGYRATSLSPIILFCFLWLFFSGPGRPRKSIEGTELLLTPTAWISVHEVTVFLMGAVVSFVKVPGTANCRRDEIFFSSAIHGGYLVFGDWMWYSGLIGLV